MAWLVPPAAALAGTWSRQGQRHIGYAVGGANMRVTGNVSDRVEHIVISQFFCKQYQPVRAAYAHNDTG